MKIVPGHGAAFYFLAIIKLECGKKRFYFILRSAHDENYVQLKSHNGC